MELKKGDWVTISPIAKGEVERIVNIFGVIYYKLKGYTGLYKIKEITVERECSLDDWK